MTIKNCAILLLFCINVVAYADTSHVTFESAEHIFMGDHVLLTGLHQTDVNHPIDLPLQNGLQLTYGDILAMPDYYGIPNQSISSETTFHAQKDFFKKVFFDFSHSDPAYFTAFWPIIQNERSVIEKALKAHADVATAYAKIVDQENIDLALATHLQYLNLSLTGFDHFNQDAITAYRAGHAVAIHAAKHGFRIQAGFDASTNQFCEMQSNYQQCLHSEAKKQLILAYEENAFACHFLSDRFAAGHLRNPYRALYQTRPIPILGALSGNLMHNEDNRLGVIVTNHSGRYWKAYGDNYYFSPQNKTSRHILQKVLQLSADEITRAFQTGVNTDSHSSHVIALIPVPIPAGETVQVDGVAMQQTAPLYQVMLGSVWQRVDVNNPQDDEWTPIWSTIVTLLTYHAPTESVIPMQWQLILKVHHMEGVLNQLGVGQGLLIKK